eukprot:4292613-Pyramimonas_sp.AAC.1
MGHWQVMMPGETAFVCGDPGSIQSCDSGKALGFDPESYRRGERRGERANAALTRDKPTSHLLSTQTPPGIAKAGDWAGSPHGAR